MGNILSIKNLRRTAWHFLDYGASTALILQRRLETSKTSTYRYMNDLKTFKVIVPAVRTRGEKRKRGPKTDIWMVPDATIDQINEAYKLHYRLSSPKYRLAEKVAQSLLEDYLTPKQTAEITYREIITQVRSLRTSFNSLDIADLAAQYLHENGIKVWR